MTKPKDYPCRECGMSGPADEYHPLTFCKMRKAGIDPWQFVADVLWARGWEAKSIQILDRFSVKDMNHRKRRAA